MSEEVNENGKNCEKDFYVDELRSLYRSHSKTIIRNSQFLGYGILVALFHYGKFFFLSIRY